MAEYKYKVVDNNDGSASIPANSKFYLKYRKSTTVKALKGSLGIMVFPNNELAKRFLNITPQNGRIKRVLALGKKTVPRWVSRWTIKAESIERFNKIPLEESAHSIECTQAPVGTECYPKVIVVD